MRQIFALMVLGVLLVGCASETVFIRCVAPEGRALAVHRTRARFDGYTDVACMHLTSECPDRCAHGGRYANFTILSYLGYEKLDGQYGDPKQTSFAFRVARRDGSEDPGTPEPLRALVGRLDKGQQVYLDWTHFYVTDGAGSWWPERLVTRLAE